MRFAGNQGGAFMFSCRRGGACGHPPLAPPAALLAGLSRSGRAHARRHELTREGMPPRAAYERAGPVAASGDAAQGLRLGPDRRGPSPCACLWTGETGLRRLGPLRHSGPRARCISPSFGCDPLKESALRAWTKFQSDQRPPRWWTEAEAYLDTNPGRKIPHHGRPARSTTGVAEFMLAAAGA